MIVGIGLNNNGNFIGKVDFVAIPDASNISSGHLNIVDEIVHDIVRDVRGKSLIRVIIYNQSRLLFDVYRSKASSSLAQGKVSLSSNRREDYYSADYS